MTDYFQATTVRDSLRGLRLGHPIYLHRALGSTNDEAKRLAEAGGPDGLLVLTDEQTAGRGRDGRRWLTQPGTNLSVSLVVRPRLAAVYATRLVMLAGVAVCNAIEQQFPLLAGLKWPNDIVVGGYKVGGILVEGAVQGDHLDYAILGIGVNVNWAPDPADVTFPTTSLAALVGQRVNRLHLLRLILEQLDDLWPDLTTGVLLTDWQARLLSLGEPVRIRTPEGLLQGRIHTIAEDGTVTLRLENGELRLVAAGEMVMHESQRR